MEWQVAQTLRAHQQAATKGRLAHLAEVTGGLPDSPT